MNGPAAPPSRTPALVHAVLVHAALLCVSLLCGVSRLLRGDAPPPAPLSRPARLLYSLLGASINQLCFLAVPILTLAFAPSSASARR